MQSTIDRAVRGRPAYLQDVKDVPMFFVSWADQKKLSIPGGLREVVEEFDSRPPYGQLYKEHMSRDDSELEAPALPTDGALLGDGERETMLKIIAAMSKIIADVGTDVYSIGNEPNRSTIYNAIKKLFPDASKLGKSTISRHISDGLALLRK